MAATKRKRRGGLAVQAKRPKRSEKDARPPPKQRDMAEEAENEERNRIPGPVCQVRGAYYPRVSPAAAAPRTCPGFTYLNTSLRILELPRCYGSWVSGVRARLATAFTSNSRARGRPLRCVRLSNGAGFRAFSWLTGNRLTEYSVPMFCLLVIPLYVVWRVELSLKVISRCLVYPYSDSYSHILP